MAVVGIGVLLAVEAVTSVPEIGVGLLEGLQDLITDPGLIPAR